MKSVSETGHAKNVANFGEMLSFISGLGTAYKPSWLPISEASLQTMFSDSESCLKKFHIAKSEYKKAIGDRELAFEPLSKLFTRIVNAVNACHADPVTRENVRAIVSVLQGRNKNKSKDNLPTATQTDDTNGNTSGSELDNTAPKTVNHHSTSHMSMTQRIENFQFLVSQLELISGYSPNEEELKISSLKDQLATLRQHIKTVNDLDIKLNNLRIQRNKLLYEEGTGLVSLAVAVKAYIKSAFGNNSEQYKRVSKIRFQFIKRIIV